MRTVASITQDAGIPNAAEEYVSTTKPACAGLVLIRWLLALSAMPTSMLCTQVAQALSIAFCYDSLRGNPIRGLPLAEFMQLLDQHLAAGSGAPLGLQAWLLGPTGSTATHVSTHSLAPRLDCGLLAAQRIKCTLLVCCRGLALLRQSQAL